MANKDNKGNNEVKYITVKYKRKLEGYRNVNEAQSILVGNVTAPATGKVIKLPRL